MVDGMQGSFPPKELETLDANDSSIYITISYWIAVPSVKPICLWPLEVECQAGSWDGSPLLKSNGLLFDHLWEQIPPEEDWRRWDIKELIDMEQKASDTKGHYHEIYWKT